MTAPLLDGAPTPLRFRAGARTLLAVGRRLVRMDVPLADALDGGVPALPALGPKADGVLLTGVPASGVPALVQAARPLRAYLRDRYPRHHADLRQPFATYEAAFSAKRRATLRRKEKKLAERSGGALDVRSYRHPDEMAAFHRDARMVAAKTYQERLLGAALPGGTAMGKALERAAERDAVRGWLLFVDGAPAAYLHAPAAGDTLIYAHLGYDPALAALSPGTVLQLAVMRELMSEGRFRWFDFTGGDGEHKRQFATGAVACVDVLLLRPTLGNRALGAALGGWDRAVAGVRRTLVRAGGEGVVRALRR